MGCHGHFTTTIGKCSLYCFSMHVDIKSKYQITFFMLVRVSPDTWAYTPCQSTSDWVEFPGG